MESRVHFRRGACRKECSGSACLQSVNSGELVAAGKPRFARLLLEIVKLSLGLRERLLFRLDLGLRLAAVVRELGLVAQHDAGVGIVSGGAQLSLALRHVKLAL